MNPTLFSLGVTMLVLAAGLAFIAGFSRRAAVASEKRMLQMLTYAGTDGRVLEQDDTWAILHAARGRCRKCLRENLCDAWLAGNVKGRNSFCPNAGIFRLLGRITKRIPVLTDARHRGQAMDVTPGTRRFAETSVEREASIRLSPSIHSPISAVL